MNASEMIDLAANKVGGLRELGRQLDWNSGAIAVVKRGDKPLPPWRAAQIAEILGTDQRLAYLEALKAQSTKEGERRLLGELLRTCKAMIAYLTIATALGVAQFSVPETAHASTSEAGASENIHYYSKIAAWIRARVRAFFAHMLRGNHGQQQHA